MLQLRPLDFNVPIFRQLQVDQSPVVLVNIFQVAEAEIPSLLKAWPKQLHQGIAGSTVLMNYAVWVSVAHF